MAKKYSKKEQCRLCMGDGDWSLPTLNGTLPSITMSDATIGMRHIDENGKLVPSIAYPSTSVLASTWDEKLVWKAGESVANDAIDRNVDIILGPGINIKRYPLNGRNFEYFSEDPLLTGILARAYIYGAQRCHVGTSLKHYCGNNHERSRHWLSSNIDERTLHELYLRPFEIALGAKPWTVMSSYNLVNGVRMSANKMLYEHLRKQGFQGLIISDWWAVKNMKASIESGLNVAMPFQKDLYEPFYQAAIQGEVDANQLEENAERVASFIEKHAKEKALRKITMSMNQRCKLAQTIEEKGAVLLRNQENALPLKKEETILVTGAPAFHYYHGGGSSSVMPEHVPESLLQCLKNKGFDVSTSETIINNVGEQSSLGNLPATLELAKTVDVVIFSAGNDSLCEEESRDRNHLRLHETEVFCIKELRKVAKKLVLVIESGSSIDTEDWGELPDAILFGGYVGEYGHRALANILSGEVCPSGKLTETWAHEAFIPSLRIPFEADHVNYEEKLAVGYRYFVNHRKGLSYPFGFGLSYTTFRYRGLGVSYSDDRALISFSIKNTGKVAGEEVAQIYVRSMDESYPHPLRELKGFCKVYLEPNEEKEVEVLLDENPFVSYDVNKHAYSRFSDEFMIEVGASSIDIRLRKKIRF